ncbi:MAG: hypothetical protein H0W72_04280, partial [Planctomycetes bacterium]|nr:hypothetical protein [Planctomycetota bacterium]
SHALAAADRVLTLDAYQPRDVTATARRLVGRIAGTAVTLPVRLLDDAPGALIGLRHFLRIDAREAERPRVTIAERELVLDLRRSGWDLDDGLARGAILAAAWCCRLADGHPIAMDQLAERWRAFIAAHGVRGIDPFDRTFTTLPPWQLVVSVLERLPMPMISSLR